MTKHITVAKSWQELNKWQLEEIVDLYLHHDSENFSSSFNRMILILFQKKKNFWHSLKLARLLRNVPLSTLSEFGQFILAPPRLHSFPEIKGLKKPNDRLGDLSIKQFNFMDHFFHQWMDTKSDTSLRALVASIYRIGEQFDEQKFATIAKITDQLTNKQRQVIGFTYMSCFHHICSLFPSIYPKDAEKSKKSRHTPFSEIIISIAMHEKNQPLGNLHESNATRIYEFMQVFSKIIINQEKQAKENAKRK